MFKNSNFFVSNSNPEKSLSRALSVPLGRKPVKDWTPEDVSTWLEKIDYVEYSDIFYNNKVDGKVLLSLTKDDLPSIGVQSFHDRYPIWRAIKQLQRDGKFEDIDCLDEIDISKPVKTIREKENIIMSKIKRSTKNFSLSDDELRDLARKLCIKDDLVSNYLTKDFKATSQMFHRLKGKEKLNRFQSQTSIENEDDYDFEQIALEEQKPEYTLGEEVKVKLVVVEIAKTSAERNFRKLLSPIMAHFNCSPQFGLFHSALIIGPWYLEWNNSSLCVPRKCYSGAAILAVDVKTIKKAVKLDVVIDKIADVIVNWNSSKVYHREKRNCQHFIDDICAAIGIELTFTGTMHRYLSKLRKNGMAKLDYKIPSVIREKLNIKEKHKTFKTHKELDRFVNAIQQKEPEFQEKYPEDYMLLKSWDRAFWLRHLKDKDNPQWASEECAFGDPINTRSFNLDISF